MSNMSVNVAGVEWKNPVTVASGTFGSGAEYSEFVDLNRLGAVTTKGVANKPWEGNPTPLPEKTAPFTTGPTSPTKANTSVSEALTVSFLQAAPMPLHRQFY